MAKDTTTRILIFDAADQYEGFANRNESTPPVFNSKIWVETIRIESGATGGSYDIRHSDGGDPISGIITLGANEHTELTVGGYVQGLYTESFGSDGQILINTGMS